MGENIRLVKNDRNKEKEKEARLRPSRHQRNKWALVTLGIVLFIVVLITVILSLHDGRAESSNAAEKYKNGAVASDSPICSKVGVDIMKKNGSAVDSAIATIFCLGVVNLHSCGVGGGGFMVVYIRKQKKYIMYDYREMAPAYATQNMYINSTKSSLHGGSAIAVPGELKGLWTIHQKHGKLKWADLIEPSVKLAEEGYKITKTVDEAIAKVIIKNGHTFKNITNGGLRKLLSDKDGKLLRLGDKLRNPKLAETLRNIQKHNSTDFYEGELAKRIVKDVQMAGGNITLEDMKNYKVEIREPIHLKISKNLTLTSMGAPSSGAVVTMIMNIMSGYDFSKTDFSKPDDLLDFYQKLVESEKFGYAQRGLLADPNFLPAKNISEVVKLVSDLKVGAEIRKTKLSLNATYHPSHYGGYWAKDNHGTSHLSVLAPNGDAVAATETINWFFGSKVYSHVTGIMYNDEMDDFSIPGESNGFNYPPTRANFIQPGKRPLSSMVPVIVTDLNGDVKMICGGSGGSRIISGTVHVLAKKLLVNLELGEAVESFRLHHQGIPNQISPYTGRYPPRQLIEELEKIGHKIKNSTSFSAIQAIYKGDQYIHAKSDNRKGGRPAGF